MKKLFFAIFLISSIQATAKVHTLKKGETIATLARMYYGEPVFGPKGSLKKILALNPQLKGNPNAVEPGQDINIDDNLPPVKTPVVKATVAKKSASKIIVDFDKKLDSEILKKTPEITETQDKKSTPVELQNPPDIAVPAVAEDKNKNEAAIPEVLPEKVEVPAPTEPRKSIGSDPEPGEPLKKEITSAPEPVKNKVVSEEIKVTDVPPKMAEEKVKTSATHESFFFARPTYSQIRITATHNASGSSVDLVSSTVFGGIIGWDHAWSESFSTLISVDYKGFKSDSTSRVTAAPVIDSADLYHFDLAMLNKIGKHGRYGFGLSYSQDIFIETDATTLVPISFLATEIAPFFMADFTLVTRGKIEMKALTKVIYHAGEADTTHDTKKGYGFLVGFSFERKMSEALTCSAGISYETSNQARVGMDQKRDDATLELGLQF